MSSIFLKFFGGMIPRRGEQHLDAQDRLSKTGFFRSAADASAQSTVMSNPQATEAENCNLYSGELRPLVKPALSHKFCKPGDACFNAPLVTPPVAGVPPEPPNCVPAFITTQPDAPNVPIGDNAVLAVGVNTDASVPVMYQWYENNELMPGEVAQVLNVTITIENQYSQFAVFVRNPCGEEVSKPVPVIIP